MFFIREENVRPGNRGGRNLFNWNDIRLMNNKDRESYLGVTQSIGFLDKGGKWRKRDWWLNHQTDPNLDIDELEQEKEMIRREEDRLIREKINGKDKQPNVKKEDALTEYEWKEMMKKEANFTNAESRPADFYETDEHKPGLGVKANISFRTNPYDQKTSQNLSRLSGFNYESTNVAKGKDLSAYLNANELEEIKTDQKNDVKDSSHKDKKEHKEKKKDRKRSEEKKEHRDKKKHKKRSRSRSHKRDKKDRKH
jgi:hypothetical protein